MGCLRGPSHHRVVRIRHHHRSLASLVGSGRAECGAPSLDQHPHLGDPVELVPREIEEHHHFGFTSLDQLAEVALVDLEHRDLRPRRRDERRDVARRHVGPGRIGGDRPAGRALECGDEHPGHRRLPVGAGHQGDRATLGQVLEEVRVDEQSGAAADDGATPPREEAGQAVAGAHRRRGERRARRKRALGPLGPDRHAEGRVRASSSGVGARPVCASGGRRSAIAAINTSVSATASV